MKSPYYRVITRTAQRDLTNFITSFQYQDSMDHNDILTLKLKGVPVDLLEDRFLGNGIILLFSWGYLRGASSGQRLARITNVDTSYNKQIDVTIKAMDLGITLRKGRKNFTWQDVSVAELASQIASKNSMQLDLSSVGDISNKIKFLPQVNEDDFTTLKKALMIEGTGNFVVYTKDDTIFIKPRSIATEPKRTYRWNNANGALISFKPTEKDTSKSDFSAQTDTISIDPMTNELVSGTNKDDNEKLGTFGSEYLVDGYEDFQDNTQKAKSAQPQEETQAKLIMPVDSANEADILANQKSVTDALEDITAVAKVEGDPNIFSDDVVTISNVKKSHGGNWFIKSSTHMVSKSGYTTSLQLGKNGTNEAKNTGQSENSNVNNAQGPDETDNKKVVQTEFIVD